MISVFFSCAFWLFTLHLSPLAETPQQVAGHEVPPRLGPPGVRRGGASGPREGRLHRVGAVLREEGVCRFPCNAPSPPPPRTTSTSALRQTRNPSFPPSPPAPQGLSHQGSSASGRARARLTLCTRPLGALAALDQELTPDSEPLDTAWT